MAITRAQFLRRVLGGAATIGLAPVVACGGDDGGPAAIDAPAVDAPVDAPPDCTANGARGLIALNHGHSLMVAAADIADPAARTYDITGEATHGHTVMLTAADFAELAANRPVTVTSSAVGHSHVVTVICA